MQTGEGHILLAPGGVQPAEVHILLAPGDVQPAEVQVLLASGGVQPVEVHILLAPGRVQPAEVHILPTPGGVQPPLAPGPGSVEECWPALSREGRQTRLGPRGPDPESCSRARAGVAVLAWLSSPPLPRRFLSGVLAVPPVPSISVGWLLRSWRRNRGLPR